MTNKGEQEHHVSAELIHCSDILAASYMMSCVQLKHKRPDRSRYNFRSSQRYVLLETKFQFLGNVMFTI